ncbi:hypothetical protein [Marisediminicola antarctica]|uniref:DUF3558 domain-containing protein n=1 Tax=Marisediminicola antarctica TaxID=674079 RepID=A0A7L5AGY1_9MICO|nr:hypothetical protein [Marisediminicola antarctica]QHO69823.1 hypothetical protein BHD05_09370 [Marisediminicola antarctica]
MTHLRSFTRAAAVMLLITALAGCAGAESPGGSPSIVGPEEPPTAIPADGEVLGIGTVLQKDGDDPQLCLGAVAESYPPPCGGPPISGWDWATVDGEESASGVTWGTYAVQGTWDGARFTVTQPPIMLALYDAMANPDPRDDPANAGATDEGELLEIQEELQGDAAVLGSYPSNGYLFVDVIYDDGQIQRYMDEIYGENVVAVRSALRDLG